MRLMILLMSLLVTLPAGPAAAGKKAGVTLPDTITVAGKPLTLNGMGLREATWLKIDVYVAGLYVEHVSSSPDRLLAKDEPKLLILRFVRDVGRGDILKAWNDGFKNNSTVPVASIKPLIDQFNSWMPSFNDGDSLLLTYVPGKGVTVHLNNVQKGVINDDNFVRSLFSIWLGPKPPTGALKSGLLGNHPRAEARR